MAEDATVLAMFTDIRGFTRWSEANEVFINLDHFISGFLGILVRRFPPPEYRVKHLGDGALLMAELPDKSSDSDIQKALIKTLGLVYQTNQDFKKHCDAFARRV